MQINAHGGNIYKKAKELKMAEEAILDFSANISPLGLPPSIKEAMVSAMDGIVNYPDPECQELRQALAACHKLPISQLTCGNGGADLLYRLAFGLKPGHVLLAVPAFVEYEEAMTAGGATIHYYRMEEDYRIKEDILEAITGEISLVILCNPNNPTGILTPKDLIKKIIKKARKAGAYVLIDECFLELTGREADYSMIEEREDHVIILKSFTKLYAIPGVRLGYLIACEKVIEKVNRAGQAWSVSHLAQVAGLSALKERDYRESVIKEVARENAFLKEKLKTLPLRVFDGAANYLFFQAPGIKDLDRRLEKDGILIRNCSNYVNLGQDYWRVAVRSHEDNLRLLAALEKHLG